MLAALAERIAAMNEKEGSEVDVTGTCAGLLLAISLGLFSAFATGIGLLAPKPSIPGLILWSSVFVVSSVYWAGCLFHRRTLRVTPESLSLQWSVLGLTVRSKRIVCNELPQLRYVPLDDNRTTVEVSCSTGTLRWEVSSKERARQLVHVQTLISTIFEKKPIERGPYREAGQALCTPSQHIGWPHKVELQTLFGNHGDDVVENERGRLSAQQRLHFKRMRMNTLRGKLLPWALVNGVSIAIVAHVFLTRKDIPELATGIGILVILVGGAKVLSSATRLAALHRDIVEGVVIQYAGLVSKSVTHPERPRFFIQAGSEQIRITREDIFRAIQSDRPYRVFLSRSAREILGMDEVALDPSPRMPPGERPSV